MYSALATLINRLGDSTVSATDVIEWGSPVPSFGDVSIAQVATLGLNPSNREFVDELGNELTGSQRRFHTLTSLGLDSWSQVDARHLRLMLESYRKYFRTNPYDRWFKKLDQVVSGTRASYYDDSKGACHLDLIPYATARKWAELTTDQRSSLMAIAGDTLALLLKDSPVRILILNGKSVVQHFQAVAQVCLQSRQMPTWALPRNPKPDVMGIAYKGVVNSLCGIELRRELLVLGFNHNLQSSFGVTTEVIQAIRRWISRVSRGVTW